MQNFFSFLAKALRIQSGPDTSEKSGVLMNFLNILGVTEEMPVSSRSKFLEKFLTNNFVLSDAQDNTSGLLNRGCMADLPLLRTLSAIRQKSQEPSFWEMMDSFVLLAYLSFATSRIL